MNNTQEFEIDANIVIGRLRSKLSETEWQVIMLESQLITLQQRIEELESNEGSSAVAE